MSPAYPNTTTAITSETPCAANQLQLGRAPLAALGPEQVLIKVVAAGVNRPDLFQRMGLYPPPPGASPVLGLEVSGYIAAVGSAVVQWAEGDAVCALLAGGGYAHYAVADSACVLPLPDGVSLEAAAALPETCFTVYHNLFERAALQAGEWLLVHGGSSGIGTTAIQMAVAAGVNVIATAGSEAKCQACLELGATRAVNYREEDFVTAVKELTGSGANVILDMVGGSYVARNIAASAPQGRIVNIAFLQGSKLELDLMPVMLKQLVLTGSTLRSQPLANKARIAAGVQQHVWPMIERGQLAPVVAARFALAEAGSAHALMESSQHIGKIVLLTEDTL
ncbi:NAD(P)H-quinone oxidoreductase [Gammaproteobacteria bacterium LSUCC0057]|uniref:NAD(P)H-quinone oxidoreductase n=1 Tax=Gammaproteobacteria bacterium LSUCC0057 TaxID=2559237 RepID=A0A4Y8UIE8_9GAMM|nr:NAD(P)H-quinone oxidoreductase [Gammaproteobacteria bacterium LSUCC0057]